MIILCDCLIEFPYCFVECIVDAFSDGKFHWAEFKIFADTGKAKQAGTAYDDMVIFCLVKPINAEWKELFYFVRVVILFDWKECERHDLTGDQLLDVEL